MFCQKCGSQLNEGAAFCPKCGAKTDAASGIRAQGTNENSVNQQPMGGQPVNISPPNQTFYTMQNLNSQEQVQYDPPIKKRSYTYRVVAMIIGLFMILCGVAFPGFLVIGLLIFLISLISLMNLILFGIIIMLGGGGLIIYGNHLNDNFKSQVESIFTSGTTNPGNAWIIAGAVALLIGLLLTITGIVNTTRRKQ